jgi:hypothetical protein
MTGRRVQIYLVSNATLQDVIAGLLAGIDSIVVEAASSDFDDFVVVESPGPQDAEDVLRFVQAVDPEVKLIHTSTIRPVEPTAV